MKRDVQLYFIEQQKQMNKMNKILEKVNKEISEGQVSDEQRANFENYYNTVRSNYERIEYIIHLLNKPPKFIQKIQENKIKRRQEKQMKELLNDSNSNMILEASISEEEMPGRLEVVSAENQEVIDKAEKEFPNE